MAKKYNENQYGKIMKAMASEAAMACGESWQWHEASI